MGADLELFARRKNGSEFPVEISLSPLETEQGMLVSSAIRDITAQRRSEQDAIHFAAVVESSHDAIIGKDLSGIITTWNGGAEQLYGYRATEIVGKSISVLVPAGRDDELPEILGRVRKGERVHDYETVKARKDGTHVDVSLTVSPIRNHNGAVIGASTIARDISHRLRYQQQLVFLAEHDALTGARNRRHFEREVSNQVGRSRRYGEQAVVLIVDINGFKPINDIYGHAAGDRALKAIAGALRQRLRETDVVARMGGDEFALLLPYADVQQGAVIVADLRRVISECSIEVGDHPELHLSASIGLAQIDKDTVSDEAVFAAADKAMYADKKQSTRENK